MTDEPEIERCVCGAEAALTRSGNEDYPESMTMGARHGLRTAPPAR